MTAPQILRSITFLAYQLIAGHVNFSSLKPLDKSGRHYQAALLAERHETDALALGSAVHLAVLEPERFSTDVVVFDGTRRGKAWDEFQSANEGKTIVKPDTFAQVIAIRDSILSHPVAGPLFAAPGENELSLTWTDPATGIDCKARLDRLAAIAGRPTIIDIKTTRDASPRKFGAASFDLLYHAQIGGCYRRGYEVISGKIADCVIVAAETSAPYTVAVYQLSDELMDLGLAKYNELLAKLSYCRENNDFGLAYPETLSLEAPRWATFDESDSLGLED